MDTDILIFFFFFVIHIKDFYGFLIGPSVPKILIMFGA